MHPVDKEPDSELDRLLSTAWIAGIQLPLYWHLAVE